MRLEWQERLLRERYAEERNEDLARECGVSVRTVGRWASELGLRKSEGYLARQRWNAYMVVAWMRLCGKRVGGTVKGGTAGSFGRRRLTEEQEKKRIAAIRNTAWEERKRVIRGEKRKTGWKMVDYSEK